MNGEWRKRKKKWNVGKKENIENNRVVRTVELQMNAPTNITFHK